MALSIFPKTRDSIAGQFPSRSHTCPYCSKTLKSRDAKDRHIIMRAYCHERHLYAQSNPSAKRRKRKRKRQHTDHPSADERAPKQARTHDNPPLPSATDTVQPPAGGSTDDADSGRPEAGGNESMCGPPFVEKFPVSTAGAPVSSEVKPKPDLRAYMESCGKLGDPETFGSAELLMMTVPKSKDRTRHLQSPAYKGKTPWKNNRALLIDIDNLPHGPGWDSHMIEVGEGSNKRIHVVFKRNIIDVVKELIGNPRFKESMRYAPERHWTSNRRKVRVYNEYWSGNWWWRTQYLIRDKTGTIAPLIIASDMTTLSRLSGGQYAYPVYLTIGNISKSIRRKPTQGASMVIGYLPVDSFKDVTSDPLRIRLKGELLHRSLEAILEPLKTASKEGVPMWCADGRLRRVYPILASWIGDWPEQNDVSCTIRSGCPVCKQKFKGRGSGKRDAPMRGPEETLEALRKWQQTGNMAELRRHGLQPWWPFWADLPHVHFANCITPDLLHQLHKGLFKTHVMGWVDELMDEDEMDARFKSMPCAKDLRHFKRGVSSVSQWTGRELKEMMKQFLPVVATNPTSSEIPAEFVEMVRALLDFCFLAHSARLTETELAELEEALDTFHRLKEVVVRLELLENMSKFDWIPKLHMLGHYAHSIREFGTPDGYNSETPERLHIEFAKKGWEVSNRRNPIPQIIKFVQRREAIKLHRAHLNEFYGSMAEQGVGQDWGHGADMVGGGDDGNDEDDEDEDEDDDEVTIDGEHEGRATTVEASDGPSDIAYPRPDRVKALKPTRAKLSGTQLIAQYGAADLIWALRRFLAPKARALKEDLYIDDSEEFDVWHKLSLFHHLLPFAPDEPPHRDVIRAHAPVYDDSKRLKRPGVFDTALFLKNPAARGLHRFRACRVRAIFSLPSHLSHLHPGTLAYVELFTPFDKSIPSIHQMHTVSLDIRDGQRRSLIIPIDLIVMGCHLAPYFNRFKLNELGSNVDVLATGRRFFLNHYYNYHFFQFIRYWRRLG